MWLQDIFVITNNNVFTGERTKQEVKINHMWHNLVSSQCQ